MYLRFRTIFILVLSVIFCPTSQATNRSVNEGILDYVTLNNSSIMSADIELSNEEDFSSMVAITYSIDKISPYKPNNITLLLSSENVFTGARETELVFEVGFLF